MLENQNIAYTELINVLVALKVWHNQWAGLRFLIKCDNQSVVSVLITDRTRDSVMAKYTRNIFLWLSTFNIDIKVVHVPGKLNPVADLLSRLYITPNNVKKLQESLGLLLLKDYCMSMNLFNFAGGQPLECKVAQLATSRQSEAFAESTKKAYASMFRVIVAFATVMSWTFNQVTVLQLLCFLECVQYNGIKAS